MAAPTPTASYPDNRLAFADCWVTNLTIDNVYLPYNGDLNVAKVRTRKSDPKYDPNSMNVDAELFRIYHFLSTDAKDHNVQHNFPFPTKVFQ